MITKYNPFFSFLWVKIPVLEISKIRTSNPWTEILLSTWYDRAVECGVFMGFNYHEYQSQTVDYSHKKCQKSAKEVSMLVKSPEIVCSLQDL